MARGKHVYAQELASKENGRFLGGGRQCWRRWHCPTPTPTPTVIADGLSGRKPPLGFFFFLKKKLPERAFFNVFKIFFYTLLT
ncbi:hypothetical protein HanIR_Chr04g0183561 [Helianthus annuus]|nr:hypothetical protein HanIR_Chr04g0183561 [Helianthus annuus]